MVGIRYRVRNRFQVMDYNELNLSTERPCRFSGTKVMGWGLEQEAIAQTLLDGCLSDAALAQYY